MTISSVGAQSSISQILFPQQASAPATGDFLSPAPSSPASGGSNALTTSASNLSSQTLQALMNMTQGSDPTDASSSNPASAAKGHHHHHGGPPPSSSSDPSSSDSTTSATTTNAAQDPTASIAELGSEDENESDTLEAAFAA